jgi:hypothetical protein
MTVAWGLSSLSPALGWQHAVEQELQLVCS